MTRQLSSGMRESVINGLKMEYRSSLVTLLETVVNYSHIKSCIYAKIFLVS